MLVKDTPNRIKDALISRGWNLDDQITMRNAVSEYTSWQLGDSYWGETIYDSVREMEKINK